MGFISLTGDPVERRPTSRLTLSNRQENLKLLRDFVQEWARERGLSAPRRASLEKTAGEIFLHLIQAYRSDQPGSIAISLEEKGPRVRLMFEDNAPPYDPTSTDHRGPGAAGAPPAPAKHGNNLGLVRQSTDSLIYYRTADQKNRLVVFLTL